MRTEIIPVSGRSTALAVEASALPVLVEHAGPAARFAWDEFFYAEHHNPQPTWRR
jgi:integrase/recombinase XerD